MSRSMQTHRPMTKTTRLWDYREPSIALVKKGKRKVQSEPLASVKEHLTGRHDQKSHGHRRRSGVLVRKTDQDKDLQ
jgi:hypothetical protein